MLPHVPLTSQHSAILEEVLVNKAFFFKEVYFTDSIYSVYKDKLQNCSCNQFE